MIKIFGIKINDGIAIGRICVLNKSDDIVFDDSVIIAAKNLTPKETLNFSNKKIDALIVTLATPSSHTAILSRIMEWPAISGIDIKEEWHNQTAIIDGFNGFIIIEPNIETLHFYQNKYLESKKRRRALFDQYKGKHSITQWGYNMHLYANIANASDVKQVIENDAEGIGNFKTEFMYLDRIDYPSEDELFNIYKTVAESMNGKKVVIRTFDIGADKTADYFQLDNEENPALGFRAIRIGLERPEIFKTQLRAIIRASAFGNVSIMYPMITSTEEVKQINHLVSEVMNELRNNGLAFADKIEQGIMIETPAAVMISDELAKLVDYFSIGTNDLTQYMLATDRQNIKLDKYYNPYHPAIMRSIKLVVENAHKAGIWVEISGELGADPTMTKQFIDCGIDALAVPSNKILSLRKHICEL